MTDSRKLGPEGPALQRLKLQFSLLPLPRGQAAECPQGGKDSPSESGIPEDPVMLTRLQVSGRHPGMQRGYAEGTCRVSQVQDRAPKRHWRRRHSHRPHPPGQAGWGSTCLGASPAERGMVTAHNKQGTVAKPGSTDNPGAEQATRSPTPRGPLRTSGVLAP